MIKTDDFSIVSNLIEKDGIATLNIKGRIKYSDSCEIYIDNEKEPNAMIVRSGYWNTPFAYDDSEMVRMLKEMKYKDAGFSGVLIKYYDMIKEIYEVRWEEACYLYYLDPKKLNTSRIMHRVSNLELSNAEYVNEFYTYKGKNSLEAIKRCINKRPSSAVFDKNSVPISWVLIKDDGSMGIMYTTEENRGKGIATSVSIDLARKIIDKGDMPFIHINVDNKASIALAESMGFKKHAEVMWFGVK